MLDVINSQKFSSFIIQTKCIVNNEYDGCCMISNNEGAVCTVRASSRFVMDTYRYTYTQLTTQVVDAIMYPVIWQERKFKDTLPDPVPKEEDGFSTKEYMDYYSCTGTDVRTSSQTFECTGYQPDWRGRDGEGVSDGYPRFGKG